MAKKDRLKASATGITTSFNNVILALKTKEDIHVFEEKPRTEDSGEAETRKDAHELFALFTADIIKKNVLFSR